MTERRYEYEVTADVAQFRRAMADAERSASTASREITSEFSRMGTGVTNALSGLRGVLAGAFSIGAVTQFGRAIAASTLEAERSTALLNATLRSTGFAAGQSRDDIEALVADLSKLSGFDDDPIREGATSLLRFRDVAGDTFREAARLAVDLAVATGTSVPDAFVRVGKALQDPQSGMRGLREVGVKLTEGQEELAVKLRETGDAAGSQRIVLDQLQAAVGGAGATAGGGLTGATRSLANAWDDLLKNLGQTDAIGGNAKRTLEGLSRGVSMINRVLAEPASGLSATISAGAPAKGKVGELSEAEALALQKAGGPGVRIAEPKPADKKADAEAKRAREKAARDAEALAEAVAQGSERQGRAGAQVIFDQLNEITKARRELQDEIEKGIQSSAEFGQSLAAENRSRVAELVGETKEGRTQAVYNDLRLLNEAFDAGQISAKQLGDTYGVLRERLTEIDGGAKQAASALKPFADDVQTRLREIEGAVRGFGNRFTDSIVESMKRGRFEANKILSALAEDFARLAVQRSITAPLFNALAGSLGGLFGGRSAPAASGTYYGARAMGGPVYGGSGGGWFTVGERGVAESLYVPPGGSGMVVPGGAGAPVVNQTFNIAAGTDAGAVFRAASLGSAMAMSTMARNQRIGAYG